MKSTEIFDLSFKLREYFEILDVIQRIKKAKSIRDIDSEISRLKHIGIRSDSDLTVEFDLTKEYGTKTIEAISMFLINYEKEFKEKNIEIVLE